MPNNIGKFSNRLTAITEAEDVVTLRQAVMDALAVSGIVGAFFLAPLTSDPRVGRILTNTGLSRIWERHYRARLHKIDPLPRIGLSRSASFNWPEGIAGETLDAKEKRYMNLIARYGMARGIAVACYGPHGRSGFLGVAWPFDDEPDPITMQRVQVVGQSSFLRYCGLIKNESAIPVLSNRELEVLSWISEGKSNSVIAQILEISRSSVDIYVRRVFAKLDVADRTAASLKGYSLGLTVPGQLHQLVDIAKRNDPGDAM